MRRLELLDYGRFFAALAVLAFHYGLNGIGNGKIQGVEIVPALAEVVKYGYLGVEFFFLISGYVICRSTAGKTPGEFLVSRLVRLYPAFWAGLALTTVFTLLLGDGRFQVSAAQVLVNATMVPGFLGVPYVDGVYWTLEFELAFYLLVLAIIVFGSDRAIDRFSLLWPFVLLAAHLAGKWYWPYLGNYFCFFSGGCLLALVSRDGYRLANIAGLEVALFLCIDYSAGKAAELSASKGVEYSEMTIGALVVLMFGFFMLLNTARGATLRLPAARYLGSLTYPLYLVHAHIGYMLISALAGRMPVALAYLIAIAVVLGLATGIHRWVERGAAEFWTDLFTRWVGNPVDALLGGLRRRRAGG